MAFLHYLSIVSLLLAVICALIIVADILSGHKQQMMIMNIVYPLSALYAGPLALVFYYKIGRKGAISNNKKAHGGMHHTKKPFWQSVAIGALHCGSGCTLGDMMAEAFLAFIPVAIFGSSLTGSWTVDFVFAFVIGIGFQYYALKPMSDEPAKNVLISAIKADTLSLTGWQIGMYGWMAFAFFVLFGHKIPTSDPLFWFMMQIAMVLGFFTAFPINWWLIKKGIKEAM